MLILFAVSAISQDVAKEIINTSEEMPRFPGCEGKKTKEEKYKCADEKLMNYIYSNLNYPKEGSIEGRVTVRFVVTKEGKIDNVEVLRDIGGGCGEEAKRVIESMNSLPEKWIPGKQGGRNVNVYFTMPVIFKL